MVHRLDTGLILWSRHLELEMSLNESGWLPLQMGNWKKKEYNSTRKSNSTLHR